MAFTETEKAQIRLYTGYQARFGQFDGDVERAINAIGSGDHAATETLVRTQLTELERIDAAIVAAEGRFKAAEVGSIKLNPGELGQLRSRGEQTVTRLALLIGVEVRVNVFRAGSGYRAGAHGPSGGGNAQRQG